MYLTIYRPISFQRYNSMSSCVHVLFYFRILVFLDCNQCYLPPLVCCLPFFFFKITLLLFFHQLGPFLNPGCHCQPGMFKCSTLVPCRCLFACFVTFALKLVFQFLVRLYWIGLQINFMWKAAWIVLVKNFAPHALDFPLHLTHGFAL